MSGNDFDADGDRRLRSPSVTANLPYLPRGPTSNQADVIPERSSSPAIKRPASELDGEEEGGRASNREDQSQRNGSPLRSICLPTAHSAQGNNDVTMELTESSMNEDPQGERYFVQESGKFILDRGHSPETKGSEALNTFTSASDYNNANTASSVSDPSTVNLTPDQPDGSSETQSTLGHEIPSIDEQIAKVTELSFQPLREGDRGYLVTYDWVMRVKSKSSEKARDKSPGKEIGQGEIGPIDNSTLVAEGG